MTNEIELNFDGSISNLDARSKLHVPVFTRKTTIKADKTFENGSYSVLETLVSVSDLYIDLSYQRKPNEVKVSQIARNFNPDAFGVIICSAREDDTIAVIDGGHRVAALRMLNLTDARINCLVYFGLTLEEEAKIFATMNQDRSKPKTSDIFKAEVIAGNTNAVAIDRILNDLNLVASNAPGYGKVRGLATVKQLHKSVGTITLKRSFTTLTEAFGNHSSTYNIDLLGAVSYIYKHNPTIDTMRLIQSLKKFGSVDILISQAKTMAIGSNKAIRYTTLCSLIINSYNHKLRTNRLPDHKNPTNMNKVWE